MPTTTSTDVTNLAHELERAYIDEAWDRLAGAYADDVLLDVNLPQW